MHDEVIAIFCTCDEVLKYFRINDDPQCRMFAAEIMTFALVAAIHFRGDYRTTRLVLFNFRYFPNILSYSRLVRRIHGIPDFVWWMVFQVVRMYLRHPNPEYFIVDSFPVRAYENQKSFRAKLFKGKNYHGYTASKKQYFFGIKVHMIIDQAGIPIEFCFTPGSTSDISGLKELPCELPEGSVLFADKAYTSYSLEDDLLEMARIQLTPKRRSNLKRQNSGALDYVLSHSRNRIETVFSSIVSRMPRHIRAKTEKGFYLKILLFILAYLFCVVRS